MRSTKPPAIENAPGLTWKPRKAGWEARWAARTDLVRDGFEPKSSALWIGTELSDRWSGFIADRCRALQADMQAWADARKPTAATFDNTLAGLAACYTTDPISPYHGNRYFTRKNYDGLIRRLVAEHGTVLLVDIKYRTLVEWHKVWTKDGKIPMAHALVGMLRTLIGFGTTILEDDQCARLSIILHKMKFKMGKPRTEYLTAPQAVLIRAKAHEIGLHSIAIAQAFQYEGTFRQKDIIGEWVPVSEPGISDVVNGNDKWLRGLRWEEIDADMILHHVTSKRNKLVEPTLTKAPMVMEELARLGALPTSGPIVICESTGQPWSPHEFRRKWREIARACGIPDSVKNMDTRAGAITEATDAGAPLELVRHAATHSNISTTQNYSRNALEKTAEVQDFRTASRKV